MKRLITDRLLALSLAAAAGLSPMSALAQDDRPHAGMLRYPDVSQSHIAFMYANDLWLVPREGGQAQLVANPPGQETVPRFSPDGQTLAFVGNYEGDRDLYTLGVNGGQPFRVTHHPANEMLSDWTADGRLIFMNYLMPGGHAQAPGLYAVDAEGGMPEALPVPYGGNGAISADGVWLAYTPTIRDNRSWKRYQGGLASDIWLFNLETNESQQITDFAGTDTNPMWHGQSLYYLSDDGESARLNLWHYNLDTGAKTQITDYEDNDIKFPAIGPGAEGEGEIVFQLGSDLMLLDLGTNEASAVEITVPGVRQAVRPMTIDAADYIADGDISATGQRIVVEARGDIWTLAADTGPARNLTRTTDAAERAPAWSTDGKWVSYYSDVDGEYNLYITQSDGRGETIKLTDLTGGYFSATQWSPDASKILFQDQRGHLYVTTLPDGDEAATTELIDTLPAAGEVEASWSHDSNWIAYARAGAVEQTSAIWVYSLETGERTRVTSPFFNASAPTFDRAGDFLYFVSNMDYTGPTYDDWYRTFVYSDTGQIVAIPLRSDVESPFLESSDEEEWEDEAEEVEGDDAEAEDGDAGDDEAAEDDADIERHALHGTWSGTMSGLADLGAEEDTIDFTMVVYVDEDGNITGTVEAMGESEDLGTASFDEASQTLTLSDEEEGILSTMTMTLAGDTLTGTWEFSAGGQSFGSGAIDASKTSDDGGEAPEASGTSEEPLVIDFEGIEGRGILLPIESGSYALTSVNDKNQLLYMSVSGVPVLMLFDINADEPGAGVVVAGIGGYAISGDGKKLGIMTQSGFAIVNAAKGQSAGGGIVSTDNMRQRVNPREEWHLVLRDVWRRYRDYFYVENMHGVDWDATFDHYDAMVDDAVNREDLDYIIGEMIGEVNVGHAYNMGGVSEDEPNVDVGLLGADLELATTEDGTAYRIARIIQGGDWDVDARGPLSQLGIDINEGDFILAVNGLPIDTAVDPWAAFIGLADDVVTLTVSTKPVMDDEAREVTLRLTNAQAEIALRFRAWVEDNRKYVEERSGGRVGYIYVPDTGTNGQNELFRQFYGQMHMDALLIDERFNGGGQIPDRFIELLNRPVTNAWALRYGRDWQWPPDSHPGPKAMLINGWAGSGGDMFPWLFRHNGLGKIIGTRTWGGLVGISGVPPLIDGGYVTVPNFGFYENDGTWGIEGHGVEPDIEVIDDPAKMLNGNDPQLNEGVRVLLEELENGGQFTPAPRPADPDRSGIGIPQHDH